MDSRRLIHLVELDRRARRLLFRRPLPHPSFRRGSGCPLRRGGSDRTGCAARLALISPESYRRRTSLRAARGESAPSDLTARRCCDREPARGFIVVDGLIRLFGSVGPRVAASTAPTPV